MSDETFTTIFLLTSGAILCLLLQSLIEMIIKFFNKAKYFHKRKRKISWKIKD